jgi:hypothetical protein
MRLPTFPSAHRLTPVPGGAGRYAVSAASAPADAVFYANAKVTPHSGGYNPEERSGGSMGHADQDQRTDAVRQPRDEVHPVPGRCLRTGMAGYAEANGQGDQGRPDLNHRRRSCVLLVPRDLPTTLRRSRAPAAGSSVEFLPGRRAVRRPDCTSGSAATLLTQSIRQAQTRAGSGGLLALVIGIVLALWSTSASIAATQVGMDVAYDVPKDRRSSRRGSSRCC